MAKLLRQLPYVGLATLVVVGLTLAFWPQPIKVELDEVRRGPLRVTVEEDGVTRIRDRYRVDAPLAGKLRRINLLPGDPVVAGDTVVAVLEPTAPQFLDSRAVTEATARVSAAEAAVQQARSSAASAKLTLDNAQRRRDRALSIASSRALTREEVEQVETTFRVAEQSYRAAQFAEKIADYEFELAKAASAQTQNDSAGAPPALFEIRSPITGVVLGIEQESERVVVPGVPILELGDPNDLELVIDVLSKDAVRISPGDAVEVSGWGGAKPLLARVETVEPQAFTRISALGVEEQRVNVIAGLTSSLGDRRGLGDNYRVEASVVVWEKSDVLVVPTSALFRHEGSWAVFVVESGIAKLTEISLGERNANWALVRDGIVQRDFVIVHPGDTVQDQSRVKQTR